MDEKQTIELSETLAWRLRRSTVDARYFLLGKLSCLFMMGAKNLRLDGLRTFCCFVGHGRSGGTLVGALLNAHPNIVMSNELNALRRLNTGLSAQQLYRVIYLVSRRQVRRGSRGGGGYTYAVPNQWQGKHDELRVIGDRKAGTTAYEIVQDPRLLTILEQKVRLDKKFMHVIRNPFDTITTTFQKTLPGRGEDFDAHLSREIRNYFARCTAVRMIEQKFGAPAIHHLFHERLIADPTGELGRVCKFLEVTPHPDYLRDCAGILNSSPHQSRRTIEWPAQALDMVRQGMKDCPWLDEYAAQGY